MPNGYFKVLIMVNLITANSLFYFALEFQTNFKTKVKIETQTITFDQLPHVVSGLSEKLDRVLEILEKVGIANPIKNVKPSRRLVYAKEACLIIGKSLSSLYRGIKAPNDPIPSYKRGKLLYFYEDRISQSLCSVSSSSLTSVLYRIAAVTLLQITRNVNPSISL